MSDVIASKEGGAINEAVRASHDGSNGKVQSFKGSLILSGENGFILMREGNFDLMCDANGLRVCTNIGFYGGNSIPKQTNVPVTVEALHAALVNLGLIS